MEPRRTVYIDAIRDFRRARQGAALEQALGWLRGEQSDLLSYEQVRKMLRASGQSPTILKEVPLDSIVGSVGRYRDFSRSFLPRDKSDEERWARVRALMESQSGLPPIEVYQIGDSYFVRDGHHRVSVARDLGAKAIEAYVTPVHTRVPLNPGDDPSDLILKAEFADFLEGTQLDDIRPGARLELTEPGGYLRLEQDIRTHHQNLQQEVDENTSWEEAVEDWYEHVYLPLVQVIRAQGILRDFPGRTEADLYLWIRSRQGELRQHLGWDVSAEMAAENLASDRSSTPGRVASRLSERFWGTLLPEELAAGPPPGDWRRQVLEKREDPRLFRDVLVPIRGDESGWLALEQAIEVGRRESARLLGLHVWPKGMEKDPQTEEELRARFQRMCAEEGLTGYFAFSQGPVSPAICARSRWADLAVMSLSHPPSKETRARLGSGVRRLIRSCPRPLLFSPGRVSGFQGLLLAYDASPKAEEALFVAAYMACAWGSELTVVSVAEPGHDPDESLDKARAYLSQQELNCSYHTEVGDPAEQVLEVSDRIGADLVLMGGYSAGPLLEVVMGSSVDEVLRRSRVPLLMCR